ncbi:MAG: S26 family signal peptidase, partial [Bacteroidota bacterium]
ERDYLFVVGDNLNDSFDSRTWGPLDANRVVGKAVLLYWSQDPSDARNGFWQRLLHPRWSRIGTPIR